MNKPQVGRLLNEIDQLGESFDKHVKIAAAEHAVKRYDSELVERNRANQIAAAILSRARRLRAEVFPSPKPAAIGGICTECHESFSVEQMAREKGDGEWGHPCFARDRHGKPIVRCESYREPVSADAVDPQVDSRP